RVRSNPTTVSTLAHQRTGAVIGRQWQCQLRYLIKCNGSTKCRAYSDRSHDLPSISDKAALITSSTFEFFLLHVLRYPTCIAGRAGTTRDKPLRRFATQISIEFDPRFRFGVDRAVT